MLSHTKKSLLGLGLGLGLECSMHLKRKILTSSLMIKMAEMFFGRSFKNALT